MSSKILILHPHFVLSGGAGRFTLEVAKNLTSKGFEVIISTIRINKNFKEEVKGINVIELGGPLSSSIFYWIYLPILLFKLLNQISVQKPDIIFSQVFPANWWGFIIKMLLRNKVKHVWMCQEPSAFIHSSKWIKALPFTISGIGARVLNLILKYIDVFLSKYVDYVFANSNYSKSLAIKAYNYSEDILSFTYPGVDIEKFRINNLLKKEKLITVCCRLTKFKNIDKVISAFSELLVIDGFKDYKLEIIGEGEYKNELQNLVVNLKVDKNITFLGAVSDSEMVKKLQTSAVLVHAADEEPFGLVPVEAMACGTPVVAINGAGPAETILHKKTGYICQNTSNAELIEGIKYLVKLTDKNNNLVQQDCIDRAKTFTWDDTVNPLLKQFLKMN